MSWSIALHGTLGALAVDVEIDVPPDGIGVLVGPNGSGKTTILRAVAGAPLPLEGKIALGTRVLFDSATGQCLPPHLRRVGYVPQGFGLFPHLDVERNVAFGAGAEGRPREILGTFGVAHLAASYPDTLSGGEKQRVALARAVLAEPDGLLLDEPLSALDATSRRRMRAFLSAHLERLQLPSLVVTHDLRDVRALGGTVFVVEGGRVVQSGTVDALRSSPGSDFVAELVGVEDAGV